MRSETPRSFDEQMEEWRRVLERLAENFRAGLAEVDPKPGACDNCAACERCAASGSSKMIADSAARERALDTSTSFIVQAPAGSGKTELLIQRYLKLLETVDSPDSVVAITFTRKAAGEMRSRVMEALRKAEAGIAPEAEHERVTYQIARNVLEHDRRLKWNLLAESGAAADRNHRRVVRGHHAAHALARAIRRHAGNFGKGRGPVSRGRPQHAAPCGRG